MCSTYKTEAISRAKRGILCLVLKAFKNDETGGLDEGVEGEESVQVDVRRQERLRGYDYARHR